MASVPTQGVMTIVIQMPESAGGETDGGTPTPDKPKTEGNTSGNPVKGGKDIQAKIERGLMWGKGMATQATNAYVSQIGLSTGNYEKQRRAEQGLQGISAAANMITALATGNYVAVATMAVSYGISAYFEQKQLTKEREIENYQAAQYAKRIGYSVDRR